ncbi:Com family DNA-binding transcriptional regulator [Aestuariivita sp.]|uniref:Com family DNA-binding transcriptional regulator n=1 Tax=Aestuariivita sp. TaxID=1872407 RepID=UPI003414D005
MRCAACARLLFKASDPAALGCLEIKCPRCKTLTILRPNQSPEPKRPERDE